MRSPALADSAEPIIACHECDALYERSPIPEGARADCPRCGVELYRHIPRSLDRSLALYLATLVLMIIANVFPFMSMETAGSFEENQV